MKHVFCQLNPDQIIEGHYVVEDGFVVMHDPEHGPVYFADSDYPVRERLPENVDPDVIARRLTRAIHKFALGEDVHGFWNRIDYSGKTQIGQGDRLKYKEDGSIA